MSVDGVKISLRAAGAPAQATDRIGASRGGVDYYLTAAEIAALAVIPAVPTARNYIHNGAMELAQENTTLALPSAAFGYGSVDRWAFLMRTAAAGIANQVASGLATFKNALKIGRTAASALTGEIVMEQALETQSSVPLQGKNVVLSFRAKAGANFSAAGNSVNVRIYTGTGIDQTVALLAGSWTGAAVPLSTAQAITAAWVTYSFTCVIGATATQVGIYISYTPTGVAGADDNLYITGIQLEEGTVAGAFQFRDPAQELVVCQRFVRKSYSQGSAVPANTAVGHYFAPASANVAAGDHYAQVNFGGGPMRAAPTVTTYSYNASTVSVCSSNTGVDLAAGSATVVGACDTGFKVSNGSGGAIAPGTGGFIFHWIARANL